MRGVASLGLLLLAVGSGLLGQRAWLEAKALVAEQMIERAFRRHLHDGEAHLPWSWADTHPVARLEVPRLGVRRTVLAGASGASMAFGPGHIDGTADPNSPGNCVLAGHRDSWFAFLRELREGDELRLITRGRSVTYEVIGLQVVSENDGWVLTDGDEPLLTLVTCYPFDALTRGPLRYVVFFAARPDPGRVWTGGEPWKRNDVSSR